MYKFLLLSCTLLIGFSSCQKEIFDNLENDLIGTWYFDNARQKTHEAFSTYYSIYSYFQNDQITFNSDGTAIYREANGDELIGEWQVRSVTTSDSEGNTSTQYIISIALIDSMNDLVQYVWETQMNINHRLTVHETTADYINCFDLSR